MPADVLTKHTGSGTPLRLPQPATRAALPAGVLTDPTWPVSLCFRMSQESENDKVIEQLQAKVSADLALALTPEPPCDCHKQPKEQHCLQEC